MNDPTTAVEVILRLGSLMRTLLITPLPPPALQDGSRRPQSVTRPRRTPRLRRPALTRA
ncbi:DUF2254 domain-containing protein [Streptomyces sp. tea 10]|nr:DUF2254 domain-containing protein [Streptomyces sp. tea 10]